MGSGLGLGPGLRAGSGSGMQGLIQVCISGFGLGSDLGLKVRAGAGTRGWGSRLRFRDGAQGPGSGVEGLGLRVWGWASGLAAGPGTVPGVGICSGGQGSGSALGSG